MKRVEVVLEKTNTGYSAYAESLPGCVATGSSLAEVKENMQDAINFHLEGLSEYGENIPDEFKGDFELSFKLDITDFFEWFSGTLTKSGMAKITKLNQSLLSQYANGVKKPSKKQLERIQKSLHEFGTELQSIHF